MATTCPSTCERGSAGEGRARSCPGARRAIALPPGSSPPACRDRPCCGLAGAVAAAPTAAGQHRASAANALRDAQRASAGTNDDRCFPNASTYDRQAQAGKRVGSALGSANTQTRDGRHPGMGSSHTTRIGVPSTKRLGARERLPRCGGDRRGGTTPDHEVRCDQDLRPTCCRPCTASASAWSVSGPASSIRSVPQPFLSD